MKNFLGIFLALVFFAAQGPLSKTAWSCDVFAGGEGHEIPTPFGLANYRYELADGEIYALPGQGFVDAHFQPTFAVDTKRYSSLTHPEKSEFRYYPLDVPPEQALSWESFSGVLLCRAHGKVVHHRWGSEYVISLEPIRK